MKSPNPMTHNRELCETISSLSQIRDISSSLPLGESLRLLPKVHSPSAYLPHFFPQFSGLRCLEPVLSSYRFQQNTADFDCPGLLIYDVPLVGDRFVGFVQHGPEVVYPPEQTLRIQQCFRCS